MKTKIEKQILEHLYKINGIMHDAKRSEIKYLYKKVKNYSSTNCAWIEKWAQPLTIRMLEDHLLDRRRATKSK